jgi:hypothetical protein
MSLNGYDYRENEARLRDRPGATTVVHQNGNATFALENAVRRLITTKRRSMSGADTVEELAKLERVAVELGIVGAY